MNLDCIVLSFYSMQIVLENIIDFDILIHFDIIIETTPNLNKT